MKSLNFVVDYDINGKKWASAVSIHMSNNLIGLMDYTALQVETDRPNARWTIIRPSCIFAVESRKKAVAAADAWNATYKADGRLYDFKPVKIAAED